MTRAKSEKKVVLDYANTKKLTRKEMRKAEFLRKSAEQEQFARDTLLVIGTITSVVMSIYAVTSIFS